MRKPDEFAGVTFWYTDRQHPSRTGCSNSTHRITANSHGYLIGPPPLSNWGRLARNGRTPPSHASFSDSDGHARYGGNIPNPHGSFVLAVQGLRDDG